MTVLLTNPRERTRFLRFAVVGLIGAVVDFGVLNILVSLGMHVVAAGTLSFIAAVVSNFIWNRYWTYPDSRSKPILRQIGEFFFINILGLVIRIPILWLLDPPMRLFFAHLSFPVPFFSTDAWGDNVTLAIAVVVVMFWNFFANRYWTYSDVEA